MINGKIYNNKIEYKRQPTKEEKCDFKNIIFDILAKKDYQDNKINLYLDVLQFGYLVQFANDVLNIKNGLTYKNIKDAILSSITHKMVSSGERYVKNEGYAVSIANFLKSIQASDNKKVEHEKYQDFLNEQAKRLQLKKDKELAKARKKANKTIEKQQKSNKTLKTKID